MAFLSRDNPGDVLDLIDRYPDFQPLYEQIYQMCRNVEDVMGIFSDELRILDENTVRYMMDEQQKELEEQRIRADQAEERVRKISDRLAGLQAFLKENVSAGLLSEEQIAN